MNRQAGNCNQQASKLTDRPVARGLKLRSDTRGSNGHRYIKHVRYFTDSPRQAGNLQKTVKTLVLTLQKCIVTGLSVPVETLHE